MFSWDQEFVLFLNQFARQSWFRDQSLFILATTSWFKGGVPALMMLVLWFQSPAGSRRRIRGGVLATLAGCIVAVLAGRVLQRALPYIPRPKSDPGLAFNYPYGPTPQSLMDWNSFPSDHAVLFFGAAAGIWMISRLYGGLAFLHALLIVGLARLYIGYHYPSDILAGAVLGIGCVVLTGYGVRRYALAGPFVEAAERFPRVFSALFMGVLYEFAVLFANARDVAWWLYQRLISL